MKLTIRWSLIIGFLCLIWGTYAVTTTSTFVSSQKTLNGHARNIMENIADLAMEKSQNHLALAQGAAVLTRRLVAANVVSVNENNIDSLEQYFLDQLFIYSHFAGIYLGKPNGDFFYVSRNGQRSPGGFRTKIISHRNGVRKTALTWRDKNLDILSKELDPDDSYDPRMRPWYKKVLEHKKIVWTDPYIFFTSQKPGITIAPLQQTLFNHCKSGLKFFESAIWGVPLIATAIPDLIRCGTELLFAEDEQGWLDRFEMMLEDAPYTKISKKIENWTTEHCMTQNQLPKWLEFANQRRYREN